MQNILTQYLRHPAPRLKFLVLISQKNFWEIHTFCVKQCKEKMQNELSMFTKNFIPKRDDRRDDKVVTFEKLLFLLSFKNVPVLLNIKYKVLGA